ncbi:helix-turn-helix domain-containing protein [Streptomyces sp. SYSU K217416]
MSALAGTDGAFLPDPEGGSAEVFDFASEKVKRRAAEGDPHLRLCAADGTGVELPATLVDALLAMAELFAAGKAVAVTAVGDTLSTTEAAELLGVSRPTVVRWLEEGRIPYDQPGKHRRVKLVDLVRYRARRRAEQQQILGQMVSDDLADGLYEV